jgi:hypothetical protein
VFVNALGEIMTINTNPAGRLAEFFKTTRKDTGADILVNSGIKKIKTGILRESLQKRLQRVLIRGWMNLQILWILSTVKMQLCVPL